MLMILMSLVGTKLNRQIIFEKRSFRSGQHPQSRARFRVPRATLLYGDWMHCLASSNKSALLFQRTFKIPSGLKSGYLNYVVALVHNL